MDSRLELDPWIWEAERACSPPRPIQYHRGTSFNSLEIGATARVAIYLRTPSRYLSQLRSSYDLIEKDKPRLKHLALLARVAADGPTGSMTALRLHLSYQYALGVILALQALMGCVLRGLTTDSDLWAKSSAIYNEAVELGNQVKSFRPYGANFIPDVLRAVWAASWDLQPTAELEAVLREYETDAAAVDFLSEALVIRKRLQGLIQRERLDSVFGVTVSEVEKRPPACIIL